MFGQTALGYHLSKRLMLKPTPPQNNAVLTMMSAVPSQPVQANTWLHVVALDDGRGHGVILLVESLLRDGRGLLVEAIQGR